MNYLDDNRWEKLILKYLPNLEKLYLKYSIHYEEGGYEPPTYCGKPNQFISPFWIERQWIFEADIDSDKIIFSIRPYKKRWYDHMINSSTQFLMSSHLTLAAVPTGKQFYSLKRKITRIIFVVAQIFHLKIYEEIFFDALIEILIPLIYLNSLNISSLSLSHPKDLPDVNENVRSFVMDNNRITKVYLEKLNNIEEIYSLMKLCPRITYLKVDYINNMDIESFLQNILEKIKHECNEHLRLLCLRIPAAYDQVIQNLHEMIN